MKKLLEAINSGIIKGLTENNINLLIDLADSELDLLDSILIKNINTKTDVTFAIAVNKHKYVDLGLPSGNIWADYNVGATEGSRRGGSYLWCNDIDMQPYTTETLSKFSFAAHLVNGKNSKALNFKIPSEFNFDICNAVMGGKWEMPTKLDYLELINNCKIEYNTDNEECIFIGPNGNKLIFPTAEVHIKALIDGFTVVDDDAAYMGSYWTRDIDANNEPYMFTFNLYDEKVYMCTSCEDDYCTLARAVLKLSNKKDVRENTLNILSDIDATSDEDIIISHKNINNSIDVFELAYHEFIQVVEHNMQHLMQKSKHKLLSNIYVSIFNNPDNFKRFKGIILANTKNELKDLIKIGIILLGNDGNFNWIDTSKIADMSGLFSSNSKFNGDISLWDVRNVNDMSYMFYESNFNGNLYNWDVSNVKNMQFMFCKNTRFNTDISRWDITVAFELAYNDIRYPFPPSYTNGGNGIFHAFDNVPKNNLPHKCIQAYNWILNERAKRCNKLIESINRDNQGGLNDYQMKLLSDIDDNSTSLLDSLQTKSVNTMRSAKDVIIIKKFIKGILQYRNSQYLLNPVMLDDNIKNEINNPANFEKYKALIRPVSNRDFKELISAGIGLLGIDGNFNWIDTSEITSMTELFTSEFNGDISLWDVSNVTDMNNLFTYCTLFNKDISKWDVSNVTDMHNLFLHCALFNKDISKWDVSNVTSMSGMFAHTQKFNLDIGCWDVSNVTNMSSMFYFAEAFNQDISNWDVKNCKKTDFMFTGSKLDHDNRPVFY